MPPKRPASVAACHLPLPLPRPTTRADSSCALAALAAASGRKMGRFSASCSCRTSKSAGKERHANPVVLGVDFLVELTNDWWSSVVIVLGVDSHSFRSSFFSKTSHVRKGFGDFPERRIPGKNGEATPRMVRETHHCQIPEIPERKCHGNPSICKWFSHPPELKFGSCACIRAQFGQTNTQVMSFKSEATGNLLQAPKGEIRRRVLFPPPPQPPKPSRLRNPTYHRPARISAAELLKCFTRSWRRPASLGTFLVVPWFGSPYQNERTILRGTQRKPEKLGRKVWPLAGV